jgi:hypothetical protein
MEHKQFIEQPLTTGSGPGHRSDDVPTAVSKFYQVHKDQVFEVAH